jgi:hypothetical protein
MDWASLLQPCKRGIDSHLYLSIAIISPNIRLGGSYRRLNVNGLPVCVLDTVLLISVRNHHDQFFAYDNNEMLPSTVQYAFARLSLISPTRTSRSLLVE